MILCKVRTTTPFLIGIKDTTGLNILKSNSLFEIPINFDSTGNRVDRGQLRRHPDEAPVVQQIFDWRAAGNKVSTICNFLVESGTRTRHGNLIWNQNTVAGILSRYDLYVRGHNIQQEAVWEPIVFLKEDEAKRLLKAMGKNVQEEEE